MKWQTLLFIPLLAVISCQAPDPGGSGKNEVVLDEAQLGQMYIPQGDVIDMGEIPYNRPFDVYVDISNPGRLRALNIVPIVEEEKNENQKIDYAGGDFPGTAGTCKGELKSGVTCRLHFLFFSEEVGIFSHEFKYKFHNGRDEIIKKIVIKAKADESAKIEFSNSSGGGLFDFGGLDVGGNSVVREIILKNVGGLTAKDIFSSFKSPAFADEGVFAFAGGSFPGTGGSCGRELKGDESCSVFLTAAPTGDEVISLNYLEVSYNNPLIRETSRATLKVKGIDDRAFLLLQPSAIVLDAVVNSGESDSFDVFITNQGTQAASSVDVLPGELPIELKSTTCGGSIAAGETCFSTFVIKPNFSDNSAFPLVFSSYTFQLSYDNGKTGVDQSSESLLNLEVKGRGNLAKFKDGSSSLPLGNGDTWSRDDWRHAIGDVDPVVHTLLIRNGVAAKERFKATDISLAISPNDGLLTASALPTTLSSGESVSLVLSYLSKATLPYNNEQTYTLTLSYNSQAGVVNETFSILTKDLQVPILKLSAGSGLEYPSGASSGLATPQSFDNLEVIQTIFVNNYGTTPSDFNLNFISGDSEFSVANNTCPVQIHSGGSCQFDFRFFTIQSAVDVVNGDDYSATFTVDDGDAKTWTFAVSSNVRSPATIEALEDRIDLLTGVSYHSFSKTIATRPLTLPNYRYIIADKKLTILAAGSTDPSDGICYFTGADASEFNCEITHHLNTDGKNLITNVEISHLVSDSETTKSASLVIDFYARNQSSGPRDGKFEFPLIINTQHMPKLQFSGAITGQDIFSDPIVSGQYPDVATSFGSGLLAQKISVENIGRSAVGGSHATVQIYAEGTQQGGGNNFLNDYVSNVRLNDLGGCSPISISGRNLTFDIDSGGSCEILYDIDVKFGGSQNFQYQLKYSGMDAGDVEITAGVDYLLAQVITTSKDGSEVFHSNDVNVSPGAAVNFVKTAPLYPGDNSTFRQTITYNGSVSTSIIDAGRPVEIKWSGNVDPLQFRLEFVAASGCTLVSQNGSEVKLHMDAGAECPIDVSFRPLDIGVFGSEIMGEHGVGAPDIRRQVLYSYLGLEIPFDLIAMAISPVDFDTNIPELRLPAAATGLVTSGEIDIFNFSSLGTGSISPGENVTLELSDKDNFSFAFSDGTNCTIVDDSTSGILEFNLNGSTSCKLRIDFTVPSYGEFLSTLKLKFLDRVKSINIYGRGLHFSDLTLSPGVNTQYNYIDIGSTKILDEIQIDFTLSNSKADSAIGELTSAPAMVNLQVGNCQLPSRFEEKWEWVDVTNVFQGKDVEYQIINNTCSVGQTFDQLDQSQNCTFTLKFVPTNIDLVSGVCVGYQHKRYPGDVETGKYVDHIYPIFGEGLRPEVYSGGVEEIRARGPNASNPGEVKLQWRPFSVEDSAGTILGYRVLRKKITDLNYPMQGNDFLALNPTDITIAVTSSDGESVYEWADTVDADSELSEGSSYHYLIQAQVRYNGSAYNLATPVWKSSTSADQVLQVTYPFANTILINRIMANKTYCTKVLGVSYSSLDRNNFYRCSYTGPASVSGKFDLNYDLIVDTYETSYNSSSGGHGPFPGQSPKIFYNQSDASAACRGQNFYFNDFLAKYEKELVGKFHYTLASYKIEGQTDCIVDKTSVQATGGNRCKSFWEIEDLVGNAWEYTSENIKLNTLTDKWEYTSSSRGFDLAAIFPFSITEVDFNESGFNLDSFKYFQNRWRIDTPSLTRCISLVSGEIKKDSAGYCDAGFVLTSSVQDKIAQDPDVAYSQLASSRTFVLANFEAVKSSLMGGSYNSRKKLKMPASRYTNLWGHYDTETVIYAQTTDGNTNGWDGAAARCMMRIPYSDTTIKK